MWLILARSEHVKGKEAVSEEIGNFATKSTSGTQRKSLSLQSQFEREGERQAGGPSQATAWCLYTGGSNYGAQFEVDEQDSPWDQEWEKGGEAEIWKEREREAEGGDLSCFSSL